MNRSIYQHYPYRNKDCAMSGAEDKAERRFLHMRTRVGAKPQQRSVSGSHHAIITQELLHQGWLRSISRALGLLAGTHRCKERMLRERGRVVQRARPLRGSVTIYDDAMKANLAYWRSVLRQAEQELEAASTRAASKLMAAKAKLKSLQSPKTAAAASQSQADA
jgi:hypothetical protein